MGFILFSLQFSGMDLGKLLCFCQKAPLGEPWIMHGPMLPLYGSGAMVVLIVTIPVRDNVLLVFLMGMIGATILEYFTGITMERLFHVRYWDYRNLKFNVRGYICPLASLCWGAFSILMVKVVHIPFEHMVLLIPVTIADILAFFLTIAAVVDFTQSFNEAMDMKRILVFTVVDPGSSLCENQNRIVTNEKGHGFGNHARFYAKRFCRKLYCCTGIFQFNDMVFVTFFLYLGSLYPPLNV